MRDHNETTVKQKSLAGGKFDELTLRAFGKRKFGELIDQPIGY